MSNISILIFTIVLLSISHCSYGELQHNFYHETCPDVENTIFEIVQQKFIDNSTIAPAMIRLYFHDCFSGNGCDASLLLEGTANEKKAGPNLSVRGYELIDEVKAAVEDKCLGVVSCADIIALVTRDLVTLASGGRTKYEIKTGRFDGFESLAANVDLPSPQLSVEETADKFADRDLSVTDMVLLLGGHTIGVAHCSLITDRLYDFQGTKQPDPSMDSKLVQELQLKCPENSKIDGLINLDQNVSSSNLVDVSFYNQINSRRGILHIDQLLADDEMTSETVKEIVKSNDFLVRFGEAMARLGEVGVKGEDDGEVRRSCRSCKNRFLCTTG